MEGRERGFGSREGCGFYVREGWGFGSRKGVRVGD